MTPPRSLSSAFALALGLTLAGLAPALSGCATPGPAVDLDGAPTSRGVVVHLQHSASASGFLVEPDSAACGLQTTADAETRYARRTPSGRLVSLGTGAEGVRALTVGETVAVWVDGPVLESCPMQGRASTVVIEPARFDQASLMGRWIHSVEEDRGEVEVYRREGSREFPPRMFRQRYAFFEGGRAEVLVPHPADAHYTVEGIWAVVSAETGVIVVRYEGRADRLRVVQTGPDVLRIVREE